MAGLQHAQTFRDLIVYQKARSVDRLVFELSRQFPKEEAYALTDQLRRASRAVGAQIAEAWAKRRYERHFVSTLTVADGEQHECQHWIAVAHDCGYLGTDEHDQLLRELQAIGKMLNGMMSKSFQFCGDGDNVVRETPAEYFA